MAEAETSQETSEKKNYIPKGAPGTLVTGFVVQDDYLKELIGTAGQEIYEKMSKSDSQIRKLIHAVNNPIKSALWDVQPASTEKKDIEVAALIKQILFNDLPEGFKAKLDEILTFPWHGHSVFEIIHKNYDKKPFGPYTGLANLAWRDQRTLDQWEFNPDGTLKQVHQIQAGDLPVDAWMDANFLLVFYNEKKGSDLGYPFLRMLYGNYKRKLLNKEIQSIGMERGGLGTPELKLPKDVKHDSEEAKAAEEQLQNYTTGESAYFMLPHGYELTLHHNNTFDPAKAQTVIKAENEEIAGSLIGMFLEMGIGGNSGNQAGTEVSAKFFKDGLEYLADKIKEKFNREIIPKLVFMNFGDTVEVMPSLSHSGISEESGEELMRIVTGYAKAKLITPDPQLEDNIRERHNLPKRPEGTVLDNQEGEDDLGDTEENSDPDADSEDDNRDAAPVELNAKTNDPIKLMESQGEKVASALRDGMRFSSAKYINDVMVKYRQLPESKKQSATTKSKMGGQNNVRKDLKRLLSETCNRAVEQVKTEIPSRKNVQLKSSDSDFVRLNIKPDEVRLSDFSKLPAHIQVLIGKQAELVTAAALVDLQKKMDFAYSSMQTKVSDENMINQAMDEAATKFIESNNVMTAAINVVSLMVNESRSTFFFDQDVVDEIHSFTFVNRAPVAAICKELAGVTFKVTDAESLRYTPPLHHNCKSYLRANLLTSKGLDRLEISTLSPSADAKKSITLNAKEFCSCF